jgi:site-specific DNA recombinase
MKAAIYARISDEKQIDNFSISAQVKLLQDYCKKNNIEVYNIYIDEAEKGWKENRPALQKMLKEYEYFDIVLVHKFDRFARKSEMSKRLKAQLLKNKVKVISITEPIADSPIGRFQEGMLELIAEYYIDNLSHEIKKGKNERAQQGLWNSRALFGYDMKESNLIINEKESEILKSMFDMYLFKGMGVSKIADYLNNNNIRTKLNCKFTATRVSRMLRNPVYIGKIYYGGKIYNGKHEAIITEEQHLQAISMLKSNNYNPGTGRKGYRSFCYQFFYLMDIVKCAECGRNFTVRYNKYNNYYVCGTAYKYKHVCNNNVYHNTKQFEKDIENTLKGFMKGDDIEFTVSNLEIKINNATEGNLEKVKEKMQRVKEAYIKGVFSLEEYTEELDKLKNEKDCLIAELNRPINYVNPNTYKNKIKNIWNTFITEKDIAKKRAILQTAIRAIHINREGKARIEVV